MSDIVEELRAELRSLNIEELSQTLGLEKWRLYQMIKERKAPPYFKVGKVYRFPVVGLRKWMQEQTGSV